MEQKNRKFKYLKTNTLRWSYLILFLFLLAVVGCYYFLPPAWEGLRGFSLNLSTEIIGILLTVWLIDSVMRRREERERENYRSVALQRLYYPIKQHLEFLCDMYKASVKEKPENTAWTVEDFATNEYRDQLAHLNLRGPSPSIRAIDGFDGPPVPWYEYINIKAGQFREQLERVIEKYSMQLDSETANIIEELINSPFMNYTVNHIPNMVRFSSSEMGSSTNCFPFALAISGDQTIPEYASLLANLVDVCNQVEPEERKISVSENRMWRDDMAPSVGSARIPIYHCDTDTKQTTIEE